MNMAEYVSRRLKQPKNVNFEPTIRGLNNDNFDWTQVLNQSHHIRDGLLRDFCETFERLLRDF